MTERLHHPVKIGNLEINGNLFLAPLAGFTDRGFRSVCLDYGADLCYTEMISCEALYRNNRKTVDLGAAAENERTLAIQVFAGSPKAAELALPAIRALKPDLVDLNSGCPVPKIIKSGAGSALMKTPGIQAEIIKILSDGLTCPVTIKIRSGWDFNSLNYLECAQGAINAGASAVTIHARTRSQGYSGRADWSVIYDLKQNIDVPVIGNGDLSTPEDVKNMITETGCDAVMIGRGAIGNPFLFEQSRKYLQDSISPLPLSPNQKIEAALIHIDRTFNSLPELKAAKELRKHICAYTKGIPGGSEVRNKIITCVNQTEYLDILREFREKLGEMK